jgi:hypothetical protein
MFPAREGDCFVITHGDPRAPHRILVDAGRMATYPALREFLLGLPAEQRVFDLLIVTHVDRDHIEGALSLFADPGCPVQFRDIWFNGYYHLSAGLDVDFSAVQGNRLVEQLDGRAWNASFGRGPVVVPETGPGEPIELPGGLHVTVLSPTADKLRALRRAWEQECRDAGLDPAFDPPDRVDSIPSFARPDLDIDALAAAPFSDDRAPANGSSIAVLLAVDGRRLLFTSDAHAGVLVDGLRQLGGDAPVKLDLLKVSHHGSARNTSIELLALVDCPRYVISTSGAQFQHPDPEAIARIIKHGGASKTLYFNYRSPYTAIWDDGDDTGAKYPYATVYGVDGSLTLTL